MEQSKIIISYSGGKDGVLALYRAREMGYYPCYLLTTYNSSAGRSWFHGIDKKLLKAISKSLAIPIKLVDTGFGQDYARDFEMGLRDLKNDGCQACVFGDIDIKDHYEWCDLRCRNTGIRSIFPLWQEDRKKLVYETIDLGFKAMITLVDRRSLGEEYLGKVLTKDLVDRIERTGADPCGENGEYHTLVYDGPIFQYGLDIERGGIVRMGNYSALEIF